MRIFLYCCFIIFSFSISQAQQRPLEYMDIFDLKYAKNPQISPDGNWIVYRKMQMDIMKDRQTGKLWILSTDGKVHVPLSNSTAAEYAAIWSPDSKKIAYVSKVDKKSQIFIYHIDSKSTEVLSNLERSPSNLSWSPDGKRIAFNMFVPEKAPTLIDTFPRPADAKWAAEPRITTRLKHERDGSGYMKDGFAQIFTISTSSGIIEQLTDQGYSHSSSLTWSPDSKSIYFSAYLKPDWQHKFNFSDIHKLGLNKKIEQITDMKGVAYGASISADGRRMAFLAKRDTARTYRLTNLYVMDLTNKRTKQWAQGHDLSFNSCTWNNTKNELIVHYDQHGKTRIALVTEANKLTELISNMGGTTIGRPYPSGSYSVASNDKLAYTSCSTENPANVSLLDLRRSGRLKVKDLTNLNADLNERVQWSRVEDIWYKSSFDGRKLQGWIVYPPNYSATKKYPLIVENHGGPILNYGDRFTMEIQLYAAQGYIVFYPNPRGSTSYGEAFADLLYNNYPGEDYQDVMDGVDALIAKGIAHEDQLFVTGGSAGGIMTAWIIGKNNRFEAAVVGKPVINWISKTLVADNYYGYADYRYPGQPWENFDTYWKHSPISLVGNIETPTMLMVGLNDLRTPPSESKQLYHALKLRNIETMLVEIPGAAHNIAARPSNLLRKVALTVAWFEKYNVRKGN